MTNDLSWAEVVVDRGNTDSENEGKDVRVGGDEKGGNENGNEGGDVRVGTVIGTLVKCYGLVWSLNPCRVVDIQRSQKVKVAGASTDTSDSDREFMYSQIAFSTLDGHLIAGKRVLQLSYIYRLESI